MQAKKESVCFSSKTIELSENENYIELTNRVCYYNAPNLNNVELPYDDSSLEKAKTLINMPVVAKYTTNSSGEPTFKGHEVSYDEDGNIYFGTDNIGTHFDVYIKDDTVVTDLAGTTQTLPCLFAKYRIWKRNKNVVDAVHRLYNEGKLYSSWEIDVLSYQYNNNVKTLNDYVFLGNCLLGYEYAYPAYGQDAKAIQMSEKESQLLVAEAFSKDLIENKSVSNINSQKKDGDKLSEKDKKVSISASEDGVVPKNISKSKADENVKWSAPTLSDFTDKSWNELSDDEKTKIAEHYAWAKAVPPENFGDLKLPHHQASDGKVVLSAVENAAARLDQTDLPSGIVDKVKSHLTAHYHQFDKKAPWEDENTEDSTKEDKKECSNAEVAENVENKEGTSVENNVEKSELTDNDIRRKLYSAIADKLNVNVWELNIIAVISTSNTVWVQTWNQDSELDVMVFTYTVTNDEVTVSEPSNEKLSTSVSQINSTISELNKKIDTLNTSIAEASSKIQDLNTQVAELTPYKEAADKAESERIEAETAEKREQLKAFALKSGLIKESEFESDEKIKTCIDNVSQKDLNAIIAERFIASLNSKETKVENTQEIASANDTNNEATVKVNLANADDDVLDAKAVMKAYLGK